MWKATSCASGGPICTFRSFHPVTWLKVWPKRDPISTFEVNLLHMSNMAVWARLLTGDEIRRLPAGKSTHHGIHTSDARVTHLPSLTHIGVHLGCPKNLASRHTLCESRIVDQSPHPRYKKPRRMAPFALTMPLYRATSIFHLGSSRALNTQGGLATGGCYVL